MVSSQRVGKTKNTIGTIFMLGIAFATFGVYGMNMNQYSATDVQHMIMAKEYYNQVIALAQSNASSPENNIQRIARAMQCISLTPAQQQDILHGSSLLHRMSQLATLNSLIQQRQEVLNRYAALNALIQQQQQQIVHGFPYSTFMTAPTFPPSPSAFSVSSESSMTTQSDATFKEEAAASHEEATAPSHGSPLGKKRQRDSDTQQSSSKKHKTSKQKEREKFNFSCKNETREIFKELLHSVSPSISVNIGTLRRAGKSRSCSQNFITFDGYFNHLIKKHIAHPEQHTKEAQTIKKAFYAKIMGLPEEPIEQEKKSASEENFTLNQFIDAPNTNEAPENALSPLPQVSTNESNISTPMNPFDSIAPTDSEVGIGFSFDVPTDHNDNLFHFDDQQTGNSENINQDFTL